MCIATLNATLEPCQHRWYTLLQPCSASTNLSNCGGKIRLKGWERRVDHCPWCNTDPTASDLDPATHKLFGGSGPTDARRTSDSTLGSTDSLVAVGRGRASSVSTFPPIVSRSSSEDDGSDDDGFDLAMEQRLSNRRLNDYITTAVPDQIPSRKAYMRENAAGTAAAQASSPPSGRRGSMMLPIGRWGSARKKSR